MEPLAIFYITTTVIRYENSFKNNSKIVLRSLHQQNNIFGYESCKKALTLFQIYR